MGAWGAGIFEDDLSLDVREGFEELRAAGLSPPKAAQRIRQDYQHIEADPDEGPVVILALASSLLDSGVRSHEILRAAADLIRRREGLERWAEMGDATLAERERVLAVVLERIEGVLPQTR